MDKVDQAEKVIQALKKESDNNPKECRFITTSQLRRFLTAVNRVTGQVEKYKRERNEKRNNQLPKELQTQIKFLKVKLAYAAGREKSVKKFAEKAELMKEIENIGDDMMRYEAFAAYMEALVAFHKFYGGREQ